jgi:hypothetical protein
MNADAYIFKTLDDALERGEVSNVEMRRYLRRLADVYSNFETASSPKAEKFAGELRRLFPPEPIGPIQAVKTTGCRLDPAPSKGRGEPFLNALGAEH